VQSLGLCFDPLLKCLKRFIVLLPDAAVRIAEDQSSRRPRRAVSTAAGALLDRWLMALGMKTGGRRRGTPNKRTTEQKQIAEEMIETTLGDDAFDGNAHQRQSPPSGNAIFQGRDKDPETAPAIQ
jgi:hypothetical protein